MSKPSRRQFLLEAATIVGSVSLSSVALRCEAARRPRGFAGFPGVELAIATICIDGFSNRHHKPSLAAIPELGFKNVELNLWYSDTITPNYFDELKRRCDAAGIVPISVQGTGFGHAGRDGAIKDVAHKLQLIEGCRRLGCRIVKCTGARRGDEGEIDAVIATCRALVPVAEQEGVIITLENHANNVLERPEDYDRVFAAIDSPNVGMCLDTGHFEGIGIDVHEVIDRFGPRILQLDLKDCREKGKGYDTVVFGQGVTDFDSILDHLFETGFTGYLVVEQAWPEPRGDWKTDLRQAYETFRKWERPSAG